MHMPTLPSFRLNGRRALVTGGGRGLGFAAACALAQAGAHVTLCARSEQELAEACGAIRGSGELAEALVLDVMSVDAVRQAIGAADPFDILVNNAGTNRPKPFLNVTPEDFDAVVDLNLRSAYFVAQAVVARLVGAGRGGTIINMSSQMGHVGAPNRSIYCASKAGLEGLTKAMAVELGSMKIRVNTICPTFIETPMTAPFLLDHAFRDSVLQKIKLGRLGTVEDVMGAIVFLASDASALTTGSSVMVDGGWTAE
jgi:NAD(P)-dependent dehydrogenase (short-subunit alcohol dehydrogenase family)